MTALKKERTASPNSHRLSKSKFCTGIQCHKALYLKIHEPDLGAPIDLAQQLIFDQGTEVGVEARTRYPGGVLVECSHLQSQEALNITDELMKQDPPAIFEAAFVFHNTLVRVDVLKNNGDGSWDIIEVKSTSDFKDEHVPDMAIQRYVAEGSGIKVKRVFLKHLNRDCVYPDLENLFVDVDCTDKVATELGTIALKVDNMLEMLGAGTAPKMDIGPHCDEPYECAFKSSCWKHIPEHSVFELNGVWSTTKFDLYRRGIVRIKDIPENEKVSRAKVQQLKAVRTNEPVLDMAGLKAFLEELKYPLYFFDFETLNPAIPLFVGMHPRSQLPFQYSCHVQGEKGTEVTHVEYLADGTGDPRAEIAERLLKDLATKGTILAWNQSFEKTRINELAKHLPRLSNALLELPPRFVDLKDAFSKYFCHPDFHGSFSIKDVLPVLVPSMTYEGMAVNSGGGAQAVYMKLCDAKTPASEKLTYREQLVEYCKQDTFAMVALLEQLYSIVKKNG